MPYTPWPEEGCTLAEAQERTADRAAWNDWCAGGDGADAAADGSEGITSNFRAQLKSRKLIAYGRLGPFNATSRQLIDAEVWPVLTNFDWEKSTATDGRPGGIVFLDVRVFPPLLAPCRVDLVADCLLAEAFRKFVLEDPEVAELAKEALKLSPQFERVFVAGCCYVHGINEWPLGECSKPFGIIHPDPGKRSALGFIREPDPCAVVAAAEALLHRYNALLNMLRRGEVEGNSLPVGSGHPVTILRSIWGHTGFYFDAKRGDVLEVNRDSEDPPRDLLLKRWIGIVLQRPSTSGKTGPNVASNDAMKQGLRTRATEACLDPGGPPFTIGDVARVGSLSEALTHLVFRHPQVQSLRAKALAVAQAEGIPFQEDAGLIAIVTGHDEPLLPLRYFGKIDWDIDDEPLPDLSPEEEALCEEAMGPPPKLITDFLDAIRLRAGALIAMLQTGVIMAWAHTVDGHLVQIAHTIWSHEEFYIDPSTGDIYEGTPHVMTKRWTGVILRPGTTIAPSAVANQPSSLVGQPGDRVENLIAGLPYSPVELPTISTQAFLNAAVPSPPFPVKPLKSDGGRPTTVDHARDRSCHRPTATKASIDQAINALWPNGIPQGLPVQTRDQMIISWQRNNGLAVASTKTIYRHLRKPDQPMF